jgi:hypothetical protein
MDWRYGSSGRVPALQEQSSEVQTPVPFKKKEKNFSRVLTQGWSPLKGINPCDCTILMTKKLA